MYEAANTWRAFLRPIYVATVCPLAPLAPREALAQPGNLFEQHRLTNRLLSFDHSSILTRSSFHPTRHTFTVAAKEWTGARESYERARWDVGRGGGVNRHARDLVVLCTPLPHNISFGHSTVQPLYP